MSVILPDCAVIVVVPEVAPVIVVCAPVVVLNVTFSLGLALHVIVPVAPSGLGVAVNVSVPPSNTLLAPPSAVIVIVSIATGVEYVVWAPSSNSS